MSGGSVDPAEDVLAEALPRAFPFAEWGDQRQRREAGWSLLCDLRDLGWTLVPIPGD